MPAPADPPPAELPSRGVRRVAVASLVANIGIVLTGGAVRLTASGLGCPTFPRCTATSLVPTPAHGLHGIIEFGNRLLTFALVAVAVLAVVVIRRARPRRVDLSRLAWLLLAGIPAQALLGGITVLTKLNPWVVMGHFLCSMLLIGLATVLVHRSREPDGPARPVAGPLLRGHAVAVVAVTVAVVYAGTVVTGTGPHAGDAVAPRTGLDLLEVTQLHVDLVWLLIGLSVGLLVLSHALHAPPQMVRAVRVVLAVEALQAVIGYTQYFTGLPIGLVDLHMLGASLLVAAVVDALLCTRTRLPLGAETGPAVAHVAATG